MLAANRTGCGKASACPFQIASVGRGVRAHHDDSAQPIRALPCERAIIGLLLGQHVLKRIHVGEVVFALHGQLLLEGRNIARGAKLEVQAGACAQILQQRDPARREIGGFVLRHDAEGVGAMQGPTFDGISRQRWPAPGNTNQPTAMSIAVLMVHGDVNGKPTASLPCVAKIRLLKLLNFRPLSI